MTSKDRFRSRLAPCVCGYVASRISESDKHRKACEAWASRDKVATRLARVRATRGIDPSRVCYECGYVEHREGCSRFHYVKTRHERMLGGPATLDALAAASALRGLSPPGPPEPTTKRVVKAETREGFRSYYLTLECGHIIRRATPSERIYCPKCRGAEDHAPNAR